MPEATMAGGGTAGREGYAGGSTAAAAPVAGGCAANVPATPRPQQAATVPRRGRSAEAGSIAGEEVRRRGERARSRSLTNAAGAARVRREWRQAADLEDPDEDEVEVSQRNPLDVVYDAVAARGGHDQAGAEITTIARDLEGIGFSADMIQEAIENWQSLTVFRVDGATGRVRIMPDSQPPQAPRWASGLPRAASVNVNNQGRPVALLSLFDGSGLARLAIGELLEALGMRHTLVASGFAEWDTQRAEAVHRYWAGRSAMTGETPHRRLCGDVWDLLRGRPTPLEDFLRSLPAGCMLLIVAGPPCIQLTGAGRYRGWQGLCGPDSVHFFAVPVIHWAARRMRADVTCHVIMENAGSMLPFHRDAILEALGGLTVQSNLMVLDSREWSHAPRRRNFIGTLPVEDPGCRPARRPPPWEPGFALRWDGEGVVMMRSRGHGYEIRASTYQYHPRHLLYWVDSHWHAGTLMGVHRRMTELAPLEVRHGLGVIWRGEARQDEASAIMAARWIERDGAGLGFRTPNHVERARATGRGAYLGALGLTPRQLYDMVGDHFDPDALLVRVLGPLRSWLAGGAIPDAPPPLEPGALLRIYARVRFRVLREGCPAEPGPFPDDLRAQLILAGDSSLAAQGGRGAQ